MAVCKGGFDCIINNKRQGLTAAPGWDATTGFGSINFERMLRFVVPAAVVPPPAPPAVADVASNNSVYQGIASKAALISAVTFIVHLLLCSLVPRVRVTRQSLCCCLPQLLV